MVVAKWTKKDIKTLCSQLDTFWLSCRPPTFVGAAAEANAKGYYEKAIERRQDIVLAGLRGMRELLASRYASTCEAIGNAIVRDIYGEGRDEYVRRATEQARETDKDRAAFEALVLRVHHEGLPDEVKSYDPTKR